jgi:predicted TIM-barrel fold metal-dependent hydrolase
MEAHGDGEDFDPVVIVSSDTHIGPLLETQLRPYCPSAYLEDFDQFVQRHKSYRGPFNDLDARNQLSEGNHDFDARTRDLDYDGVSAEIIFHGSQNNQPIPFRSGGSFGNQQGQDLRLAAVGNHIYNAWLADFVDKDPDRHIGLAHLPFWDIEAAVKELEWARGAGLRGVNFPALQPGILEYNDPAWEPFWSVCEAFDMPLTTHSASSSPGSRYAGPELAMIVSLESGGWYARRALHWMVLSGVFERHPKLKLVLTEQPGDWWPHAMNELDSVYMMKSKTTAEVHRRVPRMPSEYCRSNVFIGASFLSPAEARAACRDGYAGNVLWGSDYPHVEGTYLYPFDWQDESMTRLALRFTFAGVPHNQVRAMAGENAARVYGLDLDKLRKTAARIGAPTFAELDRPVETIPEHAGILAFREIGPWS